MILLGLLYLSRTARTLAARLARLTNTNAVITDCDSIAHTNRGAAASTEQCLKPLSPSRPSLLFRDRSLGIAEPERGSSGPVCRLEIARRTALDSVISSPCIDACPYPWSYSPSTSQRLSQNRAPCRLLILPERLHRFPARPPITSCPSSSFLLRLLHPTQPPASCFPASCPCPYSSSVPSSCSSPRRKMPVVGGATTCRAICQPSASRVRITSLTSPENGLLSEAPFGSLCFRFFDAVCSVLTVLAGAAAAAFLTPSTPPVAQPVGSDGT